MHVKDVLAGLGQVTFWLLLGYVGNGLLPEMLSITSSLLVNIRETRLVVVVFVFFVREIRSHDSYSVLISFGCRQSM